MNLVDYRGSRIAKLVFWAAFSFAFIMAVLPSPPDIPGNPNDKLQHVAAFATLALLGSFSYPEVAPWRLLFRLSLFGALIEVVQAIPSLHRDSDVWDWVADTIAAAIALCVVWCWRRRGQ